MPTLFSSGKGRPDFGKTGVYVLRLAHPHSVDDKLGTDQPKKCRRGAASAGGSLAVEDRDEFSLEAGEVWRSSGPSVSVAHGGRNAGIPIFVHPLDPCKRRVR